MSNGMTSEKMAERVRRVLAIAKDGERSMVEMVVACDMAFELAFRIGTAEDTLEISDAVGIDKGALAAWGISSVFQSMDDTGALDGRFVAEKSKAIASVLFPELARGEVDG